MLGCAVQTLLCIIAATKSPTGVSEAHTVPRHSVMQANGCKERSRPPCTVLSWPLPSAKRSLDQAESLRLEAFGSSSQFSAAAAQWHGVEEHERFSAARCCPNIGADHEPTQCQSFDAEPPSECWRRRMANFAQDHWCQNLTCLPVANALQPAIFGADRGTYPLPHADAFGAAGPKTRRGMENKKRGVASCRFDITCSCARIVFRILLSPLSDPHLG